jgi:hypothetical protein
MASNYLIINFFNPKELYLISLGLILVSIILIALIFQILTVKRRRLLLEKSIEESLDSWIMGVILEEDLSIVPEVSNNLQAYLLKKSNHPFIINKLIVVCKNLSGSSFDKIIYLYQQYGFRESSLKKFYSSKWFKKARGIHELYMMNQRDMEDEIKRFTNSKNEFIRIEAQTAIISFNGFEGLTFLDLLTQPITEWHQLKLIEQLNVFTAQPIEGIETWLKSANSYVIMFALKLVAVYQQLHMHDQVAQCLDHPLEKIRTQAINTLARVANNTTVVILINQYNKEATFNQRKILLNLKSLAEESERHFLLEQLGNPDDNIKLLVSEILATNTLNGLELLAQKAGNQPVPYLNIYHHTKRAVA